jgi:DNA-binding transcriptional regulator YhcF (GntR family)
METPISISKASGIPKYVQISDSIIDLIKEGRLNKGQKLPSINEISQNYQLARETVVKAFNNLREKGIVTSIQGKGFYITSTNTTTVNRIFVLFDTFTSYKETLYFGMKEVFGDDTVMDIYFHHFNYKIFHNLIKSHVGNYTAYIILPMYHRNLNRSLTLIPKDKRYLVDVKPENLNINFTGIYQDFEHDMKDTLTSIKPLIEKYRDLTLVFRNTITDVPEALRKGFTEFCEANMIKHHVSYEKTTKNISKGQSFIVIDDDDLVCLVETASEKGFSLGKDIGIISYNDTPLKKVVSNGISVISTDFSEMGKQIAAMVKSKQQFSKRNRTTFVDRGSF